MENKNNVPVTVKFSKDSPIIEISSKQVQTQSTNIVPPSMPKESKKEWGDNHRLDHIFNS